MTTTNDISPRPQPPVHHLKIEGLSTLSTDSFWMTKLAVQDCVERNALGVVHGNAGCGKTFAVKSAAQAITTHEVVWLDCPYNPNLKTLVSSVLRSVTGQVSVRETRAQLEREVTRALAERPRLLVIDESQHLRREPIEVLRYFHDDPDTQFALLLVGGNDCWEVICREPMLRSRIFRAVEFKRLPIDAVLHLMPRFHPFLAEADPEVLQLVDQLFAHGNFRSWVTFVSTADDIGRAHDLTTLTEDVARNAFAKLEG